MNSPANRSIPGLAIVILALLLGACSSAPPQRHEYSLLLDALASSSSSDVEKTETLNIRQIDLPAFLQTRALAMQVAENEVIMARYHSWADRLDDSIASALKLLLAVQRPQLAFVEATDVACHLDVRFDRFHAASEGKVLSSGQYWLSIGDSVTTQNFDVSRELSIGGYANAVTALRLTLDDLANQIGETINTAGGCT